MPAPGRAQVPAGRAYVQLPIEGDLEALLKDRLQQVREEEAYERLLKMYANNPGKFRIDDRDLQENLKHIADPRLRRQVEDAFRKRSLKIDPSQLAELAKKHQGGPPDPPIGGPDIEANGPRPGPVLPPPPTDLPPPRPGHPAPAPADNDAPFPEWLRERLEGLEDSRIGRMLQDSPAFRQGLMDLQDSFLRQRGQGAPLRSWEWGKLASRLHLPDWDLSGLESGWLKLRGLHLPSVPRPNLGGLGNWKLTPPAVGSAPSASGAGPVLLWLLILACGGVVLWQAVARRTHAGRDARRTAWRLGPWPVPPTQVETRAELVRAFEYLALLLLGPAARVQNHLVVAERLAGVGPDSARRQNAAAELATLYEQARYAPEEEPLPAEALAAARRDLCLLAGVAHA